jgi:ABC-type sugar transport system permease subunit
VLVITVIEALRAFDIVYAINRGRNGLELLSVLVTDNIIGEASRIGFGSAIAVILLVISLGSSSPTWSESCARAPMSVEERAPAGGRGPVWRSNRS